jgi:FkbM family methyltransferase
MAIASDIAHALGKCYDVITTPRDSKEKSRSTIMLSYLSLNLLGMVRPRFFPKPVYGEVVADNRVRTFHYRPLTILFEEIFIDGNYKFDAETDSPLIIDCGANIGMATLFFKSMYPHARVLAFEPDPSTFDLLRWNVEANGLKNVTLYNKALYDAEGSIELYYDPKGEGSPLMSVIKEPTSSTSRTVETVRLSSFIDQPVDLLKLDVEAAEDAVLRDLHVTGKLRLIKELIVEYHHQVPNKEDGLSTFLDTLTRNGFSFQIRTPGAVPRVKGQRQYLMVHAYQNRLSHLAAVPQGHAGAPYR